MVCLRPIMSCWRNRALPIAVAAWLLVGCDGNHPGNDVEVVRLTSPDGAVDAVLSEHNPGATASFVYRIRLVGRAGKGDAGPVAAELYGATRNASAYGVDLRWQDAHTLVAEYLKAKSARLTAPEVKVDGRSVTLILRDGVENPAAPAGGMALGK
jgi:hypothetical protein